MFGTLHWFDVAVVTAFLALSLGMGFWLSRKEHSRDEFFNASRSMGWLPVGLSVMATLFSANSFVFYPSAAYGDSLRVALVIVAFWLTAPLILKVFIPVYARLNCQTAYEYLEQRFHLSVRGLASGLFILLRIGWMASASYATAVAVSGISGLPIVPVILSFGAVTIIYTMLGGLRAVMWTDVLQFGIFVATIGLATALFVRESEGGLSGMFATYFSGRENLIIDLRLSPELKFGTVAVLLGTFLEALSAYGADQVCVQRYLSARDVQTSQRGFWINLIGISVVVGGLLVIGVGLYSYFLKYPADLAPVAVDRMTASQTVGDENDRAAFMAEKTAGFIRDPQSLYAQVQTLGLQDQAFPQFVRLKFPPGLVGLLIAALLAATMSSLDSGIHSVTTALMVDFRDRMTPRWKPASEAGEMWVARLLVLLIGTAAITLACYVGQLGDVFAIAKKMTGAFGSPLLAVFILALFSPRTTTPGVLLGTLFGAGLNLWAMDRLTTWFPLWFWPLGFFSALILSMAISALPGRWNIPARNRNLTWRGVMSQPAPAPTPQNEHHV